MAEQQVEPGAAANQVELSEQDVSLRRRLLNWRTLGSIAFGIVLLVLLIRFVLGDEARLDDTFALILNADPLFILLAFLAYYATFPLRGARWAYVLRRTGTHVRFRDATEILFLSWFVNCLVPAKLGDVYRAFLLRGNFGASLSRTLGTVFIERVADIIVIFGLALAAGFWSFRGRMRPEIDALFIAGFGVAITLVVLVIGLRFFGGRVAGYLPTRISALWDRFHEGSTGALNIRSLPVIGFLTVLIWLGEGLRLYFVIRALELPEVGLGISSSVFVALGAALLTAIPLTPAGMGFVEAGMVGILALYGVLREPALAVTLTDRGISILTVIILGGILYAFSRKIRRAHGPDRMSSASPPASTGP